MRSRRQAREAALQALYQCDTLHDWSAAAVARYFACFHTDLAAEQSLEVRRNFDFCSELIKGVTEKLEFIDNRISEASKNWSLGRMSRVDRNLLRLGTYEIWFLDQIPTNVSINEAIDIAKRYCSDDSPVFINGVLDTIASEKEAHPILLSEYENSLKTKVA